MKNPTKSMGVGTDPPPMGGVKKAKGVDSGSDPMPQEKPKMRNQKV